MVACDDNSAQKGQCNDSVMTEESQGNLSNLQVVGIYRIKYFYMFSKIEIFSQVYSQLLLFDIWDREYLHLRETERESTDIAKYNKYEHIQGTKGW